MTAMHCTPICETATPDHPAAALIEAGIAEGFTDGGAALCLNLPPLVAARATAITATVAAALHGTPEGVLRAALMCGLEHMAAHVALEQAEAA